MILRASIFRVSFLVARFAEPGSSGANVSRI